MEGFKISQNGAPKLLTFISRRIPTHSHFSLLRPSRHNISKSVAEGRNSVRESLPPLMPYDLSGGHINVIDVHGRRGDAAAQRAPRTSTSVNTVATSPVSAIRRSKPVPIRDR